VRLAEEGGPHVLGEEKSLPRKRKEGGGEKTCISYSGKSERCLPGGEVSYAIRVPSERENRPLAIHLKKLRSQQKGQSSRAWLELQDTLSSALEMGKKFGKLEGKFRRGGQSQTLESTSFTGAGGKKSRFKCGGERYSFFLPVGGKKEEKGGKGSSMGIRKGDDRSRHG